MSAQLDGANALRAEARDRRWRAATARARGELFVANCHDLRARGLEQIAARCEVAWSPGPGPAVRVFEAPREAVLAGAADAPPPSDEDAA